MVVTSEYLDPSLNFLESCIAMSFSKTASLSFLHYIILACNEAVSSVGLCAGGVRDIQRGPGSNGRAEWPGTYGTTNQC